MVLASALHYQLVCMAILCTEATPENIELLKSIQKNTQEIGDTRAEILEKCGLDLCGIAFTANMPPVLVNSFGPIAFCKQVVLSLEMRNQHGHQVQGSSVTKPRSKRSSVVSWRASDPPGGRSNDSSQTCKLRGVDHLQQLSKKTTNHNQVNSICNDLGKPLGTRWTGSEEKHIPSSDLEG